jgi:hypothetical protein
MYPTIPWFLRWHGLQWDEMAALSTQEPYASNDTFQTQLQAGINGTAKIFPDKGWSVPVQVIPNWWNATQTGASLGIGPNITVEPFVEDVPQWNS